MQQSLSYMEAELQTVLLSPRGCESCKLQKEANALLLKQAKFAESESQRLQAISADAVKNEAKLREELSMTKSDLHQVQRDE